MKTFDEACDVIQQKHITASDLLSGNIPAAAEEELSALQSRYQEHIDEIKSSERVCTLIEAVILQHGNGSVTSLVHSLLAMFIYGFMVGVEMERSETPGAIE